MRKSGKGQTESRAEDRTDPFAKAADLLRELRKRQALLDYNLIELRIRTEAEQHS
jgi:hypothetical protein